MAGSSRNNLIAIAAGGGGLALAVIALVAVVAYSLRGDTPPLPPATLGDRAEVGKDGTRAKGTDELRRLGCDQAIVIDVSRLMHDASAIREGEPRYIVTCQATSGGPTCERAATTYFAALGGAVDGMVNVRVEPPASRKPACSRLYAPSGADLGAFPPAR